MRAQLRRLQVVAVLIVVAIGLWLSTCGVQYIGDGGHQLTVHVSVADGQLQSVACKTFARRHDAEFVAKDIPPMEVDVRAIANPFVGEPLFVTVRFSTRTALSGRELSRFQFRYLVVVAVFVDGRRVAKVVDLPDLRDDGEIRVTIP